MLIAQQLGELDFARQHEYDPLARQNQNAEERQKRTQKPTLLWHQKALVDEYKVSLTIQNNVAV